MQKVKIQNRLIGEEEPVFIVAELSANHLQNLDLALKTIEAIKECGADAVKLQTYTPSPPRNPPRPSIERGFRSSG